MLNAQLDHVFPGSFYPPHFYGAWAFFAAFVVHTGLKVPGALRNLRRAREAGEVRETGDLAAPSPAEPTVSRRSARCAGGVPPAARRLPP
ncbi:hypothetical protein AB4212_61270, partial [Streptomyces sp. 2MCAF27]